MRQPVSGELAGPAQHDVLINEMMIDPQHTLDNIETATNPFAPPQVESQPDVVNAPQVDDDAGPWQHGHRVYVPNGVELPHRCVHCNQPAAHRIGHGEHWITLGQGIQFNKTAYWLCGTHNLRRWFRLPMLVAVAGVIIVSATLIAEVSAIALIGWLFVSLLLIWNLDRWCGPAIAVRSRSRSYLVVTGCQQPFLDSLPTSEEPSDERLTDET